MNNNDPEWGDAAAVLRRGGEHVTIEIVDLTRAIWVPTTSSERRRCRSAT